MRCISAAYAVMQCLCVCVCVCVCVSVTFVSCVKTNKDIFEIFSPSGSHTILVFPYQMGWQYSNGNPLTGASNAGGVGKNAILNECLASLHTGVQCCQPYESRRWSVKNKAATNGGKRWAHRGVCRALFAQEDDEVFVTGSTLYAGDEGRSTPLVITHVFCCRRTS